MSCQSYFAVPRQCTPSVWKNMLPGSSANSQMIDCCERKGPYAYRFVTPDGVILDDNYSGERLKACEANYGCQEIAGATYSREEAWVLRRYLNLSEDHFFPTRDSLIPGVFGIRIDQRRKNEIMKEKLVPCPAGVDQAKCDAIKAVLEKAEVTEHWYDNEWLKLTVIFGIFCTVGHDLYAFIKGKFRGGPPDEPGGGGGPTIIIPDYPPPRESITLERPLRFAEGNARAIGWGLIGVAAAVATVVLVLDDVTGVGTADDPLLAVTGPGTVAAFTRMTQVLRHAWER